MQYGKSEGRNLKVSALMSTAGWEKVGENKYSRCQEQATEMLRPPTGSVVRRTTRDSSTGMLMEDLWVDSYTADKRIRRALKAPTDISCMVELNAVDEEPGQWELEDMEPKQASLFRAIVARVNFLAHDRCDILFASKECSRHMSAPKNGSWAALKRIGRYLLGRPRVVTRYVWQEPRGDLTAYSDSNWAGCRETRKSTSGACFMVGRHLIKAYARTQSNIALSSAEAELYAIVTAASEAIGLKTMIKDYGGDATPYIHVDATAAIGIAQRKGLGKVRHLDTQALWIQDAVRQRRVCLEKVLGTENPSDLMTKHLDTKSMDKMLSKMNICTYEGRARSTPQTAAAPAGVLHPQTAAAPSLGHKMAAAAGADNGSSITYNSRNATPHLTSLQNAAAAQAAAPSGHARSGRGSSAEDQNWGGQ